MARPACTYVLRKIKCSEMHASIFVAYPTSIAPNTRRFHQKSSRARETENWFLAELLLRVSWKILIRRKELLVRGSSQGPVFVCNQNRSWRSSSWEGDATRNRTSATLHTQYELNKISRFYALSPKITYLGRFSNCMVLRSCNLVSFTAIKVDPELTYF